MQLGIEKCKVHAPKVQCMTQYTIELASQMQATGTSLQKIADYLNGQDMLTSRGTVWTKQALAKRLKSAFEV